MVQVRPVLQAVLDRAIQVHGALGVTDDTPLAYWFRHERAARIYDGPDEVHKSVVARRILRGYGIEILQRFFEEVAFVEFAGPPALRSERLARMKELGQEISLHSPLFYPDAEETLVTALHSMVAATLELLNK